MSFETPVVGRPMSVRLDRKRFAAACKAAGANALQHLEELRDPPNLVAFLSSLFIVLAALGSVLLGDPNLIKAHAPPPPKKVEIMQAQVTAATFSTIPPAERSDELSTRR